MPKSPDYSIAEQAGEKSVPPTYLPKVEISTEDKINVGPHPKDGAGPGSGSSEAPPLAQPIPAVERDPMESEYTAEQFRTKFRKRDLAEWLKEARPYDYSNREVRVPNLMVAFLLKGVDGEDISYRQATGFAHDSAHLGDCVSFRLPDQDIVVGRVGDGSLEVLETGVKWSFIFAINRQHYFLYHRDTTQLGGAGSSPDVVFYYQRKKSGQFVFKGERIGDDGDHASYAPRSHNALDYCQNSY